MEVCFKAQCVLVRGLPPQKPPSTRSSAIPISSKHLNLLYQGELITVVVGADAHPYRIPRGLICGMSEYFDKAFNSGLAETTSGVVELKDVQRWVFECFIHWLYTRRVFWQTRSDADYCVQPEVDLHSNPDSPNATSTTSESSDYDLADPVSWEWTYLFDLYIFADAHDTRRLRTAVMDVILIKLHQNKPVRYFCPSYAVLAHACSNLPSSSPLYCLLRDLIVHEGKMMDDVTTGDLKQLPKRLLANVLLRKAQLSAQAPCATCKNKSDSKKLEDAGLQKATPPYLKDICEYHEHTDAEEQELCLHEWGRLRTVHDMASLWKYCGSLNIAMK